MRVLYIYIYIYNINSIVDNLTKQNLMYSFVVSLQSKITYTRIAHIYDIM